MVVGVFYLIPKQFMNQFLRKVRTLSLSQPLCGRN